MVVFTCNHCGDSIQKPKVEKHYETRCRNNYPNLCCVDCLKDFRGDEFKAHTKCMTEAERYGGKGFVAKANKGEKKQSAWIETVQSVLDENKRLSGSLRYLLEKIANQPNTPRKKPKFFNFVRSMERKATMKDIEAAWDLLSVKVDKLKVIYTADASKNATQDAQNKENVASVPEDADKSVVKKSFKLDFILTKFRKKKNSESSEESDSKSAKEASDSNPSQEVNDSKLTTIHEVSDSKPVTMPTLANGEPVKKKKHLKNGKQNDVKNLNDSETTKNDKKDAENVVETSGNRPETSNSEPAKKKKKKSEKVEVNGNTQVNDASNDEPITKKKKKKNMEANDSQAVGDKCDSEPVTKKNKNLENVEASGNKPAKDRNDLSPVTKKKKQLVNGEESGSKSVKETNECEPVKKKKKQVQMEVIDNELSVQNSKPDKAANDSKSARERSVSKSGKEENLCNGVGEVVASGNKPVKGKRKKKAERDESGSKKVEKEESGNSGAEDASKAVKGKKAKNKEGTETQLGSDEGINGVEIKLTKKELKAKKKKEKYEAQLQIIQNSEKMEIAGGEVEEDDRKSNKRKRERMSEENIEESPKEKKVRKDSVTEFDWKGAILSVIGYKGEDVSLKKIQKKVLAQYCNDYNVTEITPRVMKKFNKSLRKIPNVKVDKDKVFILSGKN